jgi:hypothetical protein
MESESENQTTPLPTPEGTSPLPPSRRRRVTLEFDQTTIASQQREAASNYEVTVKFLHRFYMRGKTQDELGTETLMVASVPDFKNVVFSKLQRFIKGTYRMEGGKPTVSDLGVGIATIREHGDNIVIKNLSKETCALTELDKLKNGAMYVATVFPYGPCTSEIYGQICPASSTDRSGGTSVEERVRIAERLKEVHSGTWVAEVDASWTIWATVIKDADDLEAAIAAPPPTALLTARLFTASHNSYSERIVQMERSLSVAREVNAFLN